MKEYKEQKCISRTLDHNPKSARQASIKGIMQCNRNSIQMYNQNITDSDDLISDMQAIRDESGIGRSWTACQKNFAFNIDARTIWAHSQGNRHSEPGVIMRSNPNAANNINIVTERAPCENCEQDMRAAENDRGLNSINVSYFVPYDENSQDNLFSLHSPE